MGQGREDHLLQSGPGSVRSTPAVDSQINIIPTETLDVTQSRGDITGRGVCATQLRALGHMVILYRYMPTVLIVILMNISVENPSNAGSDPKFMLAN